jgi:hypothetical protein
MTDSEIGRPDFPQRMLALDAEFNSSIGWSMVGSEAKSLTAVAAAGSPTSGDDHNRTNPYALGAKRSFVPLLGEMVWELPKALASQVPFSANIVQVSDGRQIGYVRVPHYSLDERAVNAFVEVIARFESATTSMVFDEVNNPGGSMFQMYAVLSTLTDRPLALPRHQITITKDDAVKASLNVAKAEAGEAVPASQRPSLELVTYSRAVLSEFEAGRGRLTHPLHLGGVAEILPAENHYTKKIVVLINELDYSAAEFLAAILQDNQRATLFGERTAGAGGCVKRITLPNQLGIDYVAFTWTLAWRTSGQPIEDTGVHPDVRYSTTVEDLQSGYAGYRQAVLAAIDS